MWLEIKINITLVSTLIEKFRDKPVKTMQKTYMENYKILLTIIKEDLNKWWDTPCSSIDILNVVKMSILSNRAIVLKPSPSKFHQPSLQKFKKWF